MNPSSTHLISKKTYPFGMEMKGRDYESSKYRYGFNGKEEESDLNGSGNAYDFGARIYDARLGRFLSVDAYFKNYPFMSTYCFAGNDPIRFIDILGNGPGDRVKKAKSFVGTPYIQETTSSLRTEDTKAALKNIDCSELVCRVIADDGWTTGVKHMNTSGLVNFFSNTSKHHRSDKPMVGDVFLWRTSGGGHTGIVTKVNDDGTVEITHARGKKYGTVTETYKLSYFTDHKGWKGFYRPVSESPDTKITEDKIENLKTRIEYLESRLETLTAKRDKMIKKGKDVSQTNIDSRISIKKEQIESNKSTLETEEAKVKKDENTKT